MHLSEVKVEGFRAAGTDAFECRFPGRFSVLLGSNNSGKTTLAEAIYLAHAHRFPQLPRPSAAALGPTPRQIEVRFAPAEDGQPRGQLEQWLDDHGFGPPAWTRRLERSLGKVRAAGIEDASEGADRTRVIYLPAHRNPVDELARREAEILVELLRAEQQRQHGHRNLGTLRARAEVLLAQLVTHDLVQSVEGRVSKLATQLTSGVREHHAFVGSQAVDDEFLARVLEFLLAAVNDRSQVQRLEVSGLGYVNLLHLAVTLAAIPGDLDPITGAVQVADDGGEDADVTGEPDGEAPAAGATIQAAEAEAETEEDSFFPADGFHVTLIVEEPEAHLHPQLQHGVLRFLRRVTMARPELQSIVTTHSGEMVGACAPEDLVIVRAIDATTRVARAIRDHPLAGAKRRDALRKMSLHLDAERSAALFGDRLVLVEGVSDAVLLRVFGRAWASGDADRTSRVEALSIIPMGAVPGEWIADLLATDGFELSSRVAILSDTDDRTPGAVPAPPQWVANFSVDVVGYFQSHPTLEPTLVEGNEDVVGLALTAVNEEVGPPTAEAVDDRFRQEGPRKKKGWFAYELASRLAGELDDGHEIAVPAQIAALFDFVLTDPDDGEDQEGDEAAHNGAPAGPA